MQLKKFFDALIKEEWRIRGILKDPKAMEKTQEDEANFQQTDNCHICHQPLLLDRVRDHDHLTCISWCGTQRMQLEFQV